MRLLASAGSKAPPRGAGLLARVLRGSEADEAPTPETPPSEHLSATQSKLVGQSRLMELQGTCAGRRAGPGPGGRS